jgi:thiosulfate dehydrogenase [quinone] large subunit
MNLPEIHPIHTMENHSPGTPRAGLLGSVFGVLVLRLWLGVRTFLSGLEKYAGSSTSTTDVVIDGSVNTYGLTEATSSKVYGLANYHGIPPALYDKFLAEPLLPEFALKIYGQVLGPALLATGLALLLGLATRFTLLAMGLIYTSLTVGLVLINENSGVAWLGIHIALVALMLFHADDNRFELTGKWKI